MVKNNIVKKPASSIKNVDSTCESRNGNKLRPSRLGSIPGNSEYIDCM